AFFLDVPNPWDYIAQVRAALKPGAFLCSLVPTFNQVEDLLLAMRRGSFAFIEVCEILLRYFKPEPSRIRPTDRMVAHTGFLTFGRKIEPAADPRGSELIKEIGAGYLAPAEPSDQVEP
ncbi:MAG: tRNA (adenine-N1)-methyltransferase, partial [Anaerolineae bacterium]